MSTQEHEKGKDDGAEIVVNGELKAVPSRDVSFDQVTQLAYPGVPSTADTTFTVLYHKTDQSRSEGSMVEGDTVKVHKQGTSFNVTRSIRS
jgi:Multiubiquitin